MFFEIANLILSVVTLLAIIIYAYFTYLIAKDSYEPFVSFTLTQHLLSHLNFSLINKSKFEVEVFGKLWSKINNELFEFKNGFYGDGSSWILQPFTEGDGHFNLMNITNRKGIKLVDFIKESKLSSSEFLFQIKYRKIGSNKWKKSSPQKFIYDFDKNLFWLNV